MIIEFLYNSFKKEKHDRGINVLSLFDGIACGYVALKRVGIKVNKYYSYEIDKYAIKIANYNHPDIIQKGSVIGADFAPLKGKIDLLIGGSPCQNLSCAGDKKGLEGKKSRLFFDYLRALKTVKPKYFLLENNATMTSENKNIITRYLGVEPVYINSSLVSAQKRKRFYWTNIPFLGLPKDKGLLLKDIVQDCKLKKEFNCTERIKRKKIGTLAYTKTKHNTKTLDEKSNTLTTGQSITNSGATVIKYPNGEYYIPTPIECERLQTLPDDYTSVEGSISKTQRYKCIGNGWTVDVIAHILRGLKNEQ